MKLSRESVDAVLAGRLDRSLGIDAATVAKRTGRKHEVWAGYDGEGVYAWSCTCGEGESDFTSEDAATIAGTEHLLDVGAVPA